MELSDWTIEYVKAKDAVRKSLKEHAKNGDEVTFKHSHKTHHFLIAPELLVPKTPRDWYTIVCLNSEDNLSFLIDNWESFQLDKLSILFVNPADNQYWLVNPKVHSMIADEDNLAEGLESMAQQVPYV